MKQKINLKKHQNRKAISLKGINYPLLNKGLKKWIINYNELSKTKEFQEWKDILFGPGLCGLDYEDIQQILENKRVKLSKIAIKNLKEAKTKLKDEIDGNCNGMAVAVKVPDTMELSEAYKKTLYPISGLLNEEAYICYQLICHKNDKIEIFLLSAYQNDQKI